MFQPVFTVKINRIKSILFVGVLSALVCACGGSSSGDSDPGKTPPPDTDGEPSPPVTDTPAPPQTIRVDSGNTNLTVYWSPASGAESYLVYVDTGAASEFSESAEVVEAVGSPLSLLNLENGVQYKIAVAAVSDGNAGEPSAYQLATPVAGLNDSGIEWCLTAEGKQGVCSASVAGQDGAIGRDTAAQAGTLVKKGAGEGGFDFTALQDENSPAANCITDNHTGLVWEVKTESGLHNSANRYTWYNVSVAEGQWQGIANGGTCTGSDCDTGAYVAAVNAESLCGFNDWRLPTVDELLSVTSVGNTNPSIDSEHFPHTADAWYWTASSFTPDTSLAWAMGQQFGHIYPHAKDSAYAVRLVRSGINSPEQSNACTTDNINISDDVITDTITGLTWQRCAVGQSWTGSACNGEAEAMSWQQALAQPAAEGPESELGTAYDNGWRLPNSKELASLISRACPDALIDGEAFPDNVVGRYWSSSPFADYADATWVVDFTSGAVHESTHTSRHYVRLVRGQAAQ